MSDLFSMLGVAARALDAQRYGLDVTGQNIANVNTPGYARRSIELTEVPPLDSRSAGGGVDVLAVRAARASLIEARLRNENPAASREGAVADKLSVVETGLGQPGASLDAALTRFYNTYGALAQSPTSGVARQQVIVEGRSLAQSFNNIAAQLSTSARDADAEIRDDVQQVNALAEQIAGLNGAIVGSTGLPPEAARDQQSVALASLAQLIDISVAQRTDGGIDVSIGHGRALVVGQNAYAVTATSSGAQGFAAIISDGADVPTNITAEISGGRIAGLLQVRDVLVPGYGNRLDQLAYGVVTDVNALAQSGYDLTSAAGTAFFVQPLSAAGAARLMSVSSTVAADTNLVVAAGAPSPGNNDIARKIAALQDASITGTQTRPVDAWGDLVYRVSADTRTALEERDAHEQVAHQLESLRDQISGVSLDEEAAMLMRFQRAYEANAKFFSIVNQTLDMLMDTVRR